MINSHWRPLTWLNRRRRPTGNGPPADEGRKRRAANISPTMTAQPTAIRTCRINPPNALEPNSHQPSPNNARNPTPDLNMIETLGRRAARRSKDSQLWYGPRWPTFSLPVCGVDQSQGNDSQSLKDLGGVPGADRSGLIAGCLGLSACLLLIGLVQQVGGETVQNGCHLVSPVGIRCPVVLGRLETPYPAQLVESCLEGWRDRAFQDAFSRQGGTAGYRLIPSAWEATAPGRAPWL